MFQEYIFVEVSDLEFEVLLVVYDTGMQRYIADYVFSYKAKNI